MLSLSLVVPLIDITISSKHVAVNGREIDPRDCATMGQSRPYDITSTTDRNLYDGGLR